MITVSDYLKHKYGCKVYKIAISADVTCPNRDGTLGYKGCIFCSAGGSGEFAASKNKSIKEQINDAKNKINSKINNGKYIAYFQSFTNTYASIEYLKRIYYEAINETDIEILSIATRPDCLSQQVLDLLEEVNEIKPVWVELGLQTIHKSSANYIRRGYDLEVYDKAVKELRKRNIEVIVHVILGLPGECVEDMIETVKYVVDSGANGIKLQLLHVLRGTDLEKDYKAGKFRTMTMDEYIDLLKILKQYIPDNVIVHRLTGDGPKKLLIAPKWTADKKRVLNTINKEILGK